MKALFMGRTKYASDAMQKASELGLKGFFHPLCSVRYQGTGLLGEKNDLSNRFVS